MSVHNPSFLDGKEWYDNHRIAMILNCPRKAWYHLVGPQSLLGLPERGLAHEVGDAANFGTSVHAALATYYGHWRIYSEPRRRLLALSNYGEVWEDFFGNRDRLTIKSPHTKSSGLVILSDYFDRYEHEDQAYEPINPELSFAIEIDPTQYGIAGEYARPFWYTGRTDGVFRRMFDGDKVVNEYKTTGSGVARRLDSLKRSRQGKGYVACLRRVPGGERITGFMGVVLLVAAEKRECDRDYFPVSAQQCDSWIRQTCVIVADWRRRRDIVASGAPPLTVFYENDEECHSYGRCTYYNLCQYGITYEEVAEMSTDAWNPLDYTKESPTETVVVDKEGDVAKGIQLWHTRPRRVWSHDIEGV